MSGRTGFVVVGVLYALCGAGHADVRVPAITGEHMMLQAGAKAPVF